jgi:hypothetical protein
MDSGRPRRSSPSEGQNIEGVELHLVIMLARVKGVEIGDAADVEDDGLAIDHELSMPVLRGALEDPGKAAAPVVAVAGEQAHAIPLAGHDQAVAVVLDFMEQAGVGGTALPLVGRQGNRCFAWAEDSHPDSELRISR